MWKMQVLFRLGTKAEHGEGYMHMCSLLTIGALQALKGHLEVDNKSDLQCWKIIATSVGPSLYAHQVTPGIVHAVTVAILCILQLKLDACT